MSGERATTSRDFNERGVAQQATEQQSVSLAWRGARSARRFRDHWRQSGFQAPLDLDSRESLHLARMPGGFYEFFAGGGMDRAGLGKRWRCLFANDFSHKKAAAYRRNWGGGELLCADIGEVSTADLPGRADLVWASFPCQDLSLAGGGGGLKGPRSGTFWPFWRLMKGLVAEDRAPEIIVLENVCGTLTSHEGKDFAAICNVMKDGGYRFGALIVDAAHFVPQSRPRLFVVAVREDTRLPISLVGGKPHGPFHPRTLENAYRRLPAAARDGWIWWAVEAPAARNGKLSDLIEDEPGSVPWHTPAETRRLLSMMSGIHLAKVHEAKRWGGRVVGTVYKRTRRDETGRKVQRAEVRFDEIAGCLRTPAGGSSRQVVVVVHGGEVQSRLISSRETARLMGLPDEYVLPENYNDAYHLTGDGVIVPAVRFLAHEIFEPVLAETKSIEVAA